jgi:protein-L-isoaspartate(D-aspartate) O-methyltransferase
MFGVKNTPHWDQLRAGMINKQLQARGILNARVLDVMRRVPRHVFVPEEMQARSYEDRALPIGSGQTISQPYMIGIMLQALALTGTEKVLEIGTGTGYQAALLGGLARQVETMELLLELAEKAAANFASLGIENVVVHLGDGSRGLPEQAPYEAIVVAAGAPDAPPVLLEQLAPGGKLLIPIGDRKRQTLTLFEKQGMEITRQPLGGCSFVPLLGDYGWPAE